MTTVPEIDPNAWADAALKLFRGGGWVVPALLAFWIAANAWSKKRSKE